MPCQGCRRNVPCKFVEYHQNIGMLVVRSARSIRGDMCKRCGKKYFWEMTGLTLLTGWWGVISFVVNIAFIIKNIVQVCGVLRLADGPTGGFPASPAVRQPPPVAEPPNPYRHQ